MSDTITGLELTKRLIAFDTINPPGDEVDCFKYIAGLLEPAGFELTWHDWRPNRPNLIARLPATEAARGAPLVFSGHVDTVPLGQAKWSVDPFAGEEKDGKLYGRGTSDMKSGVAAFIVAALRLAEIQPRHAEIQLIITSGEETGCEGALGLAESGLLDKAAALVIAEPTDNRALCGHKGALWMNLVHEGVTAHGSMPDKGRNAIFAAVESIERLRGHDFGIKPHQVMGGPTLNVGNMSAGLNVNSVPDLARVGVDIRSVVGQTNAEIRADLQRLLGDAVRTEPMTDMDNVYTDFEDPWLESVFAVTEEILGTEREVATATYFTDASVLKPAMGNPPTLIMGPGAMSMAHQTDEYCEVDLLDPCIDVFERLGRDHIA
ncbi:M20 family metallopeptidase [Roseovarius sp. S4756]|uniref:M20 family metallopeptidase n=1 Tax=Roseovarius maritimus TaxID=3342637 RepID=UPI003729A98B